jgi:hypothetical protein
MPALTLQDRSIRTAYRALEKSITGNENASLDELTGLLAAVADKAGLTMTSAKTQLKNAVSVQEKMAIVKEGLSDREKADLGRILDQGTVKLSAEAKKFLEQLVGRSPVNPPNPTNGPVNIADMRLVSGKVQITGTAAANVTVEAINLSDAPAKRLHDDDTFVLGTTDSSGKLTGKVDLGAGDWLRMRTRDASGKTSDWMMIRADQLGADKKGAAVALQRIELSDAGNGKINVVNNNNSRPISEPFARLQLENTRTGQKTVIDLDDTGRFPASLKVDGKPGDTFNVAVTDGRNNATFKDKVGTLEVPGVNNGGNGAQLDDPLPHKDDRKPDGTSRYDLKRYTGPLFVNGVDPEDVVQGNIGDCYLPAAAAALAHVRPDAIQSMIKDDGNGKYTFTFKVNGRDKKVEVDGDLYSRSWGGPLYGTSSNSKEPSKMELWWPLFEKAYAKLEGDYHSIGEGGASCDVFEAVLGRPALSEDFGVGNREAMFRLIQDKLKKKLPVCMGTKDDKGHEAVFANSGVYCDHTYTVLDAYEKNGVKYVQLRNPWGESEPSGNGKDDGIFELKLDDMPKYYSVVWSVD